MLSLISILFIAVAVDSLQMWVTYENDPRKTSHWSNKVNLIFTYGDVALDLREVNGHIHLKFTAPNFFTIDSNYNPQGGSGSRLYYTESSNQSKSPFMGTIKQHQTVVAYIFILLTDSDISKANAYKAATEFMSLSTDTRKSMTKVTVKHLMDHLYLYNTALQAVGSPKQGIAVLTVGADDSFTYNFESQLNMEYAQDIIFLGVVHNENQYRYFLVDPKARDILNLLQVLEETKKGKSIAEVFYFGYELLNKAVIDRDFQSIPQDQRGALSPEKKERVKKMLVYHRIARKSEDYHGKRLGITTVKWTMPTPGPSSYQIDYALPEMKLNSCIVQVTLKETISMYSGSFKKLEKKISLTQFPPNSQFSVRAVGKFKQGKLVITDPKSSFIAVEAENENPSHFTLIFVGMTPANILKLSNAIESFRKVVNLDNVFEHFVGAFRDPSEK